MQTLRQVTQLTVLKENKLYNKENDFKANEILKVRGRCNKTPSYFIIDKI